LSSTATEMTVEHLVPPDQPSEDRADLTVVSHGQTSNAIQVVRKPHGAVVQVPIASLRENDVLGIAPRDDGSVSVLQKNGVSVTEATADGDLSFLFPAIGIPATAHAPVGRTDGIYYLTTTELRRFYDGGDHCVLLLPAGTPRAL